MNAVFKNCILTVVLGAQAVLAQQNEKDVAFFSKMKGTVRITNVAGKQTDAVTDAKLFNGDKITTGSDGSAIILYYTGKEIVLGSSNSHTVKSKQEQSSFLSNLYGTLSNLIWPVTTSKATMAGATRNPGDTNRIITATYPSGGTKIIETEPVFKWLDHRKPAGNDYILTITSEITDFKYEIHIAGATEAAYPKTAPKLKTEEKYTWRVKDPAKTAYISPAVKFSLMDRSENDSLQSSMKEILKLCNGDNTSPQWYLLTAALYRDYNLMKQAESSVFTLLALKPDLAQAHLMLATLYDEMGRLEEAKVEKDMAAKLGGTVSK